MKIESGIFFTPGYTKFCVFWCYKRRVMAKIRFDMLAKVMAPARGLSPTRAQKVKLYKNVKM